MAAFARDHDLGAPPEYRLLDLGSELGEVAKDAVESTGYGAEPDELGLETDEVGDVLFALLAVADSLDESLSKYRTRMDESASPASGS